MSYGSKQSDLRAAESEKNRAGVRVSMPVKVLAFYPDKMTVDVQPLVKESIDGQYASAAPLMGLRVACLCAGEFTIRPWYKRGDVGWVIVSDFDADAVLQTGAEAEPNTARNHAPEDGLFVGGVGPDGKAPTGLPGNAVVVAAGGTYIAVSADGVKINGNVTVTGTLSAGGIEMTTHTHPGDSGGTTGGPQLGGQMENITLKIDQETQDLVLDDSGSLELIGDAETVAQCVRLTLETFKGEWFLDTDHGTDYDQIIGDGDGDAETVLRTAIFQETNVQYIDSLTVTRSGRSIAATFTGRLKDGTPISLEVKA